MHLLPNVMPDMLSATFWLDRLDAPDAPLMAPDAFNASAYRALDMPAVLDLPETIAPGDFDLPALMLPAFDNPLYNAAGVPFPAADWEAVCANANLGALPGRAPVRWGLVTRPCSLRVLPTWALATKKPGEFKFDRLQEALLDVGWPAAVLHTSTDGAWYFVLAPLLWGWLPADCVALAEGCAAVRDYVTAEPFAVVTASRAGVAHLGGEHITAQMGTRLPIAGRTEDVRRIVLPRRSSGGALELVEGCIAAEDPSWHEGYLPCTLRTLFTQAFRLLNEPYAWGGMRLGAFGRDCSRYVKDIYGTAGIVLPRNSGPQGQVGITAARFEPDAAPADRAAVLRDAVPPGALLILPGHVMLYLGCVGNVPYAIHDLWAYTHPDGAVTEVAAVAVSDLPVAPGESTTIMTRLTHAQKMGL